MRTDMTGMVADKVTRRRFIGVAGLAALGAAVGLSGCWQSRAERSGSGATQGASGDVTSTSPGSTSTSAPTDGSAPASATGGSLVLVFSRAGENYGVGTVEVGNTMVLAKMIAEKTGAELFELKRSEPYPDSYRECCDRALEEKNSNARPELTALPDLSSHGTVYLGFPCWWNDLPMPVYTALESLDWQGKVIRPFNTHAGSGSAGMFDTLAKKCAGATVEKGLTVSGTVAQNDRSQAESSVDGWLAGA